MRHFWLSSDNLAFLLEENCGIDILKNTFWFSVLCHLEIIAMSEKVAYVCGPLTDLPCEIQGQTKTFYSKIADVCGAVLSVRAFVPHEHFDPVRHSQFTAEQVDEAERRQVCKCTSVLIVVAIAPSWGGGIEVEMAHSSRVPAVILKPFGTKVSRLLLGNPAVVRTLCYESEPHALGLLENFLHAMRAVRLTV